VHVPIPEIELQKRFQTSVALAESLTKKQQKSTQEINELFQSLMHKAFKGELPATDGIKRPALESRKSGQTLDKHVG